MLEHLFIAEKPSLAEEVAAARAEQKGVQVSKSGNVLYVGDDAVVGLFGHMYEVAPPEAYNPSYSVWNLGDLPILPDKWKRVPVKSAVTRLQLVNKLIREAKIIVNVGDAAREGQLLVDEVLQEADVDPFGDRVLRMWVRSMSRRDMLVALNEIFPNHEKRRLFNAAFCRQRADWLHGLNLSRCFTLLGRNQGAQDSIAVGRVMTPTLRLVVDRDRAIARFKPVDHYIPGLKIDHVNGSFVVDWVPDDRVKLDEEGRLLDRDVAQKLVADLAGKAGTIKNLKKSVETKAPPLPFSLSALQVTCSARLGLTATNTLEIAQRLYERYKATTYPRSDSRYLPTSILTDEVPEIVRNLQRVERFKSAASMANIQLRSAAWNDSKVSDHHAIIPTTEFSTSIYSRMSDLERKVFDIIAESFLCQFYPPYKYERQNVLVEVHGCKFEGRGRKVLDAGWRAVVDDSAEEEDQESGDALPEMAINDRVLAKSFQVQSKRTQPPAHFTDGTLIQAMTQVHRFVSDPNVKKHLREKDGLGTEATRSAIIEKLVQTSLLVRQKKKIIATRIGFGVSDYLPDELQDPGMTALWEGALDKIVEGALADTDFMDAQIKALKKRIHEAQNSTRKLTGLVPDPLEGHGKQCPTCSNGTLVTRVVKKGSYSGKRYLGCSVKECKHFEGLEGYKPPEPLEGEGTPCPACSQGKLITRAISKGTNKGRRFLSCDRYPECNHVVADPSAPKVEPLPGHGEACKTCKTGKMMTRVASKGKTKGKRFLACSNFPKCTAVVSEAGPKRKIFGK